MSTTRLRRRKSVAPAAGTERRFRNIKTKWGFSKCISHASFKDPSNGYLVNDKCIFGVDVYVIKNQGIGNFCYILHSSGQNGRKQHKMSGGVNWYSAAAHSWGRASFMPCEFNDPKKGFLVEDCCIVQADVSVAGVVNCLT